MRRLLLITAFAIALHPTTAEPLPQPTPALSIAHAAMRVSDLANSREFYRKLGFEEAFVLEKNGSPTEVFLKVNDGQFIELYPRENNSQPSGFMHVCFESSNLEGLNRLFEKREVPTSPVSRGGVGNLLFSVNFPQQQVIEFTEYMPGSMHSNDRGKHLGVNRIATHLLGVGIPVNDGAAAATFYEHQLGFRRGPSLGANELTLLLPGASGQMVKIHPSKVTPELTLYFSISDSQQTASVLRKAHVSVDRNGSNLTILDPDGNRIVLVKN